MFQQVVFEEQPVAAHLETRKVAGPGPLGHGARSDSQDLGDLLDGEDLILEAHRSLPARGVRGEQLEVDLDDLAGKVMALRYVDEPTDSRRFAVLLRCKLARTVGSSRGD